jgi:DNA-binding Lrp family transcriptional regulator
MLQTNLNLVLRINGISNTERIVLLLLNQFASEDDKVCTMSIASIASAAHISVSTARRAIKRLMEKEIIKRFAKKTETKAGEYIAKNSYYVSLAPCFIETTELLRDLLEILENKNVPSMTNYKRKRNNGR